MLRCCVLVLIVTDRVTVTLATSKAQVSIENRSVVVMAAPKPTAVISNGGPTGQRGLQGDPGPQGDPGTSVEVGGHKHVIPLVGQWNNPILTANQVPVPHISLICDFADIEPPLTTPVHIIASVALGTLLTDPQLADKPTDWSVAQDTPQANIYGVFFLPVEPMPPEIYGIPLWFKFESIDVDGLTTYFYAYCPEGVENHPTDLTLYLFDGYERHEMDVTASDPPNDPGPAETHVVTLLATGEGVAADVMYVDGQDALTLQAAKDYADGLGGGGGGAVTSVNGQTGDVTLDLVTTSDITDAVDAEATARDTAIGTAITNHSEDTDPHGDRAYTDTAIAGLPTPLALGETSTTAYQGDRGKTAYDHSQSTGNPHGAAVADITGLTTALAGKLNANDASVTNARTPTAHASTHGSGGTDAITVAQSQVTGLATSLSAKQDTITDGSLTIARTSGLQTALDAKQATITDGSLTIARTSGLQTALDAKQATITDGSLTIARTSGLQTALDAKQATITDGSLTIARTSGLQAALDAKAAVASVPGGWHIPIEVMAPTSLSSGSPPPARTADSSSYGGGRITTNSQNSYATWDLWLPAGTFTLDMIGMTYASGGVATLYVSPTGGADVSQGTWNQYSASTVRNVVYQLTGIVIASPGQYTLKFKNTSIGTGSGYDQNINKITFRRTA